MKKLKFEGIGKLSIQLLIVAGSFAIITGFIHIGGARSAYMSLGSNEQFSFTGSGLVVFGGDSLVVASKSSSPSTPHTGQVYFNTTDSKFKGYNGSSWANLSGLQRMFQIDTGGTLTDNLIAYWKLDETAGPAAGYFGNITLTNNNTTAYSASKLSNGADFGSANSSKYLSSTDSLGIDGGPITIAGWVNVTTAPGTGGISTPISQSNDGSDVGYSIKYQDSAGTKLLVFERIRNGISGDSVQAASTLTPGTWYFLVLTYDGTNLRGYKDGSLFAGPTAYSGNGTGSQTTGFRIGRTTQSGQNEYSSSLVDEVGVWNRALSASEITDLYNGGVGQTMVTN